MNKFIFLSVILFLIIIPLASATPIIQNVSVQPPYLWLGEDVIISLNCFDNNTIEKVYASIVGPDITLPTMYFTGSDGNYTLFIDKEYLDRTGKFDATISCENNISNITYTSTNFTVSRLTGYINQINPSPAYIGDIIEIDFIVKKDDIKLSSGVSFNVTLNNQLKSLKVLPAYDSNKGWILKIDSPTKSDLYDLKAIAFYDRTSISDYDTIDVRNKIEFKIVSIDKDWIEINNNITVKLKALEKGSVIELNGNNIDIKIGSADAEITSISRQDDLFNIKIIAPNIASGRYQLEAYLSHDGSSYSDSKPINYIVSIKGTLGKNVWLSFLQNGETKLNIVTDAYGHYSSDLPPDNYDIEIAFPESKLYLYGVSVSSFDDPIKYEFSDSIYVPGIRNAGLFSYEVALSYSDVDIEMKYTEKNILNEDNLKVFECSNWNSGKDICNTDWVEINGEFDSVRNKVKVESVSLSAFVVGEIKSLSVDFSLDKEKYHLDDKIIIKGIVKDEDRKTINDTDIELYIKNTKISSKTTTDENGVFSLEILAPETEGEYDLVLKAKKYPYKEFNDEKDFEVIKSRSIYIDFPDTIRIAIGENLTQEFSLTNNGQADLNNVKISLEGLLENYYNIVSNNIDLKLGEKKTFYIDFFIPIYAETGISSATLKIINGNISEEKVFGFNIFEKNKKNETTTTPTTGLVTGFVFPEISYMDLIYIATFAVICFSAAIILKKRKIGKKSRDNIKSFLFDVKNFIKKEESLQTTKSQENDSSYDKIIATEFPSFLKFSKKITKIKGDDNGKDN